MRSQLSFEPTLLLDLRLEAGYTFAPFWGRPMEEYGERIVFATENICML